ncbi:hypothetical protein MKW92_014203 [Papaver armeniacum]|nr:hypothetical protein MKW92_014203 [Papaver armeniacum]
MTINNKLLCCMLFICFLSLSCSSNAEDHNYGVTEQPSATPSIKFPQPAYGYNNTSPTSTIKDEDLATTYCVAKSFGANMESMAAALSYLAAHASYVFNLYYQKINRMKGSCDFNGTTMVTSTDPSHEACKFPDHNPGFTGSSAWRLKYGGAILALGVLMGVVFGI